MESYNQWRLQQFCEEKGLEGIRFTKEPVFMLPLSDLRAALRRPPYNELFVREILRLVGGHKRYQLLDSDEHDYLVIAALSNTGDMYPDMRQTSAVKAPVALTDLPEVNATAPGGAEMPARVPEETPAVGSEFTTAGAAAQSGSLPEEVAGGAGYETSSVSAAPRIEYGDTYPSREGDFNDIVTLELIRLPAVTNTGYIMEMASVQQLLKSGQPCPFTRNDLRDFTRVDDNPETEYALFNSETEGMARLGSTWMPKLLELRKASGLREFRRLQRIPMYKDFKELMSRTLGKELSDEDFIERLERDFNANVSSASPCRKMVLGSELFGRDTKVVVEQFRERKVWPQEGHEDFFVVLPQPGVHAPYCIPIVKRDANGLFDPLNYYRAE